MRVSIRRVLIMSCMVLSVNVHAETLTLSKAIQRLLAYYPTLQIAKLKTDQANWEVRNVKNQLSWKLSGAAGVQHDVSAFNTPYDRFEASANLNRKLTSGHTLGFSGRYRYNDDSFVLNNSFPNPSQALDVDVNYRIPFGQGESNLGYQQSLTIVEAQKKIEQLNEKSILKSLTANVISLFHEIDNLDKRLAYTETSIDRSQRLKDYISRNQKLGIYEQKDMLESEAQLLKVISERQNLRLALDEQKNALRRLLGMDHAEPVSIQLDDFGVSNRETDYLIAMAEKDDPQLAIKGEQLNIADASIRFSINQNTDKKDLLLSLGARSLYGDSSGGSVSEEDYAAQLRFEYQYDLGNDAYTSIINKAKRDKDIALEQIRLNKDDIKYQLTALLNRINNQRSLIDKLEQHYSVSDKKFKDAVKRYRQGRIDTTSLLQFENELHIAELDLSSTKTELSQSEVNLSLLAGELLPMLNVTPAEGQR